MSPFNIIYILFDGFDIYDLTAYIVILKTGIAAACFQKFTEDAYKTSGIWSVVFSVCYAMCAYQLAYNTTNIIWQDAMFVLPMVFLNINRLMKTGSCYKLIFWYAYIFISQFYMGYMIALISFIYFALLLLKERIDGNRDIIFNRLVRYISAGLISVGISAIVWLPTLLTLMHNRAADSTGFVSYGNNIRDIIRTFYWGFINQGEGTTPNTYCGLITLIMCTVFFVHKSIKKEHKIIFGVLLLFTVISCISMPLYKLWHGFDMPDGWPFRFSYIISFIMCIIGALSVHYLSELGKAEYFIVIIIDIAIFAICIWGKSINRQIYVNIGMMIAWIIILWLSNRFSGRIYTSFMILVLLLAMSEGFFQKGIYVTGGTSARVWYSTMESATDKLQEDNSFYRVNSIYDPCVNSGTLFGFNGVGHFASAENGKVRSALGLLGVYGSPRIMMNYGITPVTEMLFNIKYTLHSIYEDILNQNNTQNDMKAEIEENKYVLSLGYMVEGMPQDYIFGGENAFENNNYVLSKMTGEKISAFEMIDFNRITEEAGGLEIYSEGDKSYIKLSEEQEGNEEYVFHIEEDEDKTCYAYFSNDISARINRDGYFILSGGQENALQKNGDLNVPYIKKAEEGENGPEVKIERIGNIESTSFNGLYFYELNEQQLDEAYDALKDEQLVIEEYRDGYVKGNIEITDDKTLMFTSIPYEEGWTARVNGKKAEVYPVFNDAFCALLLEGKGNHTVEMEYVVPGRNCGLIISVVSLVIYALGIIYQYKKMYSNIQNEE